MASNQKDARLLNTGLADLTPGGTDGTLVNVLDARGFSTITAAWGPNSSNNTVRISRAFGVDSTTHESTGNLDLMTVAGSSGGNVGSTSIDWPYILVVAASSGSTGADFYVGLT